MCPIEVSGYYDVGDHGQARESRVVLETFQPGADITHVDFEGRIIKVEETSKGSDAWAVTLLESGTTTALPQVDVINRREEGHTINSKGRVVVEYVPK
jgi:hypothetical protein